MHSNFLAKAGLEVITGPHCRSSITASYYILENLMEIKYDSKNSMDLPQSLSSLINLANIRKALARVVCGRYKGHILCSIIKECGVSFEREDFGDAGTSKNINLETETEVDILPKILCHFIHVHHAEESTSFIQIQSYAWASNLFGGNNNPNLVNEINPLNALISVPRATFGPKRWSLPSYERVILTSTINEARRDHALSLDTEKMKVAMDGFSEIRKAFTIATRIIFGGAGVMAVDHYGKLEIPRGASYLWDVYIQCDMLSAALKHIPT